MKKKRPAAKEGMPRGKSNSNFKNIIKAEQYLFLVKRVSLVSRSIFQLAPLISGAETLSRMSLDGKNVQLKEGDSLQPGERK
jgi:hypothetical protein